MTTHSSLTGDALALWLETQLDFFYNNPERLKNEDLVNTLKETLNKTECQPDDSQNLYDYHRLWLAIRDTDMALQVLEKFEPQISATLEGINKQYFSILVSYWKSNLYAASNKEKFIAESSSLIQNLHTFPNREHVVSLWDKILDGYIFLKLWDQYRELYRLRIAYEPRYAENADRYLEGQLAILVEDCRTFSIEGNQEQSVASAHKLINLLKNEQYQEQVTHHTWIGNADNIIHHVPEVVNEMIQYLENYPSQNWHIANKRDLEIRVLQLQAKLKYAQNQIDDAIELGLLANYQLMGDKYHAFTISLIDWLIEANQIDKAGKIALEAVTLDLSNASEYAYEVAARLKSTHPSIYWHLILGWHYCSQLIEDQNLARLSAEDTKELQNAYDEAISAAKQFDSHHSGLQVLEFYYFRRRKNTLSEADYHKQIIEQCETYFADPNNYRSTGRICSYYRSKAHIEGIASVFQGPLITGSGATDNFFIAVDLFLTDEEWHRYVDYRSDITALKIKFQEAAKKQFEQFFETREGSVCDANIHNYSMLLRNMCVELLESYNKTPEELIISSQRALELTNTAIAICPFAEHYYGLFQAYENLNDDNAMIQAAENLWQYSVRYGFSRFAPQKVANKITRTLQKQGRHKEIQIWIERLDQWFSWLSEDQQVAQGENYFFNRIYLLSHIVSIQPEESAIRLNKELTLNPPYWEEDETIAVNIACIYRDLNQLDKAREFYELAITLAKRHDYQPVIQLAEKNLRAITERLNVNSNINQKPWWKFW